MSAPEELQGGLHTNKSSGSASVASVSKGNRLFDTEVAEVTNSTTVNGAYVLNHAEEKELCWKLDTRLLPVLALMYLFNSLDKSNLGNAKTAGFDTDIGMKGNQYNIMLSVFFIPYVLFAFPIAMLGKWKKIGPARMLPILMVVFGSMTLLSAACRNWSGFMATRWFLGMSEGPFLPLVVHYLTTFYRRGELARRLAIFYAASNIASAFSGLLSYGVFQITTGSLKNWRYLFIIEGSSTLVFSVLSYFYLPRTVDTCSFLTPEQQKLALYRIQHDSSATPNEKLDLRDGLRVFRHPAPFIWIVIEICLGVPLQSVTLFGPQIVARLGFSTVKTNLYTVAPSIWGAFALLVLAFASDLTKYRFPFIAIGFLTTLIGFVVYATIDVLHSTAVAYFAVFLMTSGTSAPSVLLSTWYNNNIPAENRRHALTAIGVPMANLMGVVSSNIFRAQDAPNYLPALAVTAAFGGLGFISVTMLGLWMAWDNARRNREQGVIWKVEDVTTEILREGPAHPSFRWFL